MTVETLPEALNVPLPLAPLAAAEWLPAVSTSQESLDDPQGWYLQTSAAQVRATAGVKVIQLAAKNLSPQERQQASGFTRHTLRPSGDHVRPLALPADTYTWATPAWSAMVKADQRVVAHVGIIYRVVQVGQIRVPVGGIGGVMTLSEWRGRGYARAMLAEATAFIATQLWAPFALVICPSADAGFYAHLGWSVAKGPVTCEQPGGPVLLAHEVAMFLPCQGDAAWPSGSLDLRGIPW